jgi:hypothetical protein
LGGKALGADVEVGQAGSLRLRAAAEYFGVLRDNIQLIVERALVKGRR